MYMPLRPVEDAAKAAGELAVLLLQEIQATPSETISHKLLFFNFSPLFPCEVPRLFLQLTDAETRDASPKRFLQLLCGASFPPALRFTGHGKALPPGQNSVFTG
jgi:hypothetical protein